ncbi:MAG: HIRAN domain-containing protein [Candidatus Muiribacteriota bacterium]
MCENKLWVYWKNSKRQRHKIGELTYDKENSLYTFEYSLNSDKLNVKKALEEGFILFTEFPKLNEKYESKTIFKTFKSRLPDFSRMDFSEIIAKHGVQEDENIEFELLKKTGGRLIIDSIDLIQPILKLENKPIIRKFPLAGVEYYDVCELDKNNKCLIKYIDFSKDTEFKLKSEPGNNFDSNAVEVYVENNKIGYIPRFYSKIVTEAINSDNFTVKLKFDAFYKNTNCPDCLWVVMMIKPNERATCGCE